MTQVADDWCILSNLERPLMMRPGLSFYGMSRSFFFLKIVLPFFRNYEGSTCIVRASCTIRKGEEITDNYGLFYQIRPQDERCEALSKQYFFACDCAPCKLHWPTFDEVRGRPSVLVCSGCRTPLNCDPAKLKKCVKCKKEVKSAALKVQRLLAG